MRPKRCNSWAWQPPAEPDAGRVPTGPVARLAGRQMLGDEPEGPPGEQLWAQTLGRRFSDPRMDAGEKRRRIDNLLVTRNGLFRRVMTGLERKGIRP